MFVKSSASRKLAGESSESWPGCGLAGEGSRSWPGCGLAGISEDGGGDGDTEAETMIRRRF